MTFYALAFAISWAGILLVIGGPANFPGTSAQINQLFVSVMLAWLAGPSLASVVMTGLVSGRAGYLDLLARLFRWRVGARWYAVALLTAPPVYVALCLLLSVVSASFVSGILLTTDRASLLLMGLAYGLLGGGFLEELGWTGFAVPRLRRDHGIFGTAIIAGVLWGAYHFSVIYWATSPSPSGPLGLTILLAQLFAWLPAYRVLMVWVYDRTQSLLVAMLMHAGLTAGMLILQPLAPAGMSLLIWLVAFAAAWWLLVAIVAVANPRQFARREDQSLPYVASASSRCFRTVPALTVTVTSSVSAHTMPLSRVRSSTRPPWAGTTPPSLLRGGHARQSRAYRRELSDRRRRDGPRADRRTCAGGLIGSSAPRFAWQRTSDVARRAG